MLPFTRLNTVGPAAGYLGKLTGTGTQVLSKFRLAQTPRRVAIWIPTYRIPWTILWERGLCKAPGWQSESFMQVAGNPLR
jgi:hypothetical protein